MMKVLLSHRLYPDGMKKLEGQVEIEIADNGNSDEIAERLAAADAFILRFGKIDRKAMLSSPHLKVIARPGVGVDTVDIAAATELGIPVVIAPKANMRSVAEHALTLMLSIAKNIVDSDSETRKGNFFVREKYAAVEVIGKTVGIVGLGNIGGETAKLCRAIGMNVCYYDEYKTVDDQEYVRYEQLHEMLRVCDFVSLHCPSTPETRGMIGAEELAMMKPTAFLINCARGDLVDEAALHDALRGRSIAGAALDVLRVEPMRADHPLFTLDNLLITPHLAAGTREATARGVVMAVEGTLAVLRGERWPHVYNKEAYDHPRWRRR